MGGVGGGWGGGGGGGGGGEGGGGGGEGWGGAGGGGAGGGGVGGARGEARGGEARGGLASKTHALLLRLLTRALAREGPALVLVEEAHLMDAASWDLTLALAPSLAAAERGGASTKHT